MAECTPRVRKIAGGLTGVVGEVALCFWDAGSAAVLMDGASRLSGPMPFPPGVVSLMQSDVFSEIRESARGRALRRRGYSWRDRWY